MNSFFVYFLILENYRHMVKNINQFYINMELYLYLYKDTHISSNNKGMS